ncbi:MAG: zf-HC2 domain-containing protein [Spirochaetales bacterium]|nr:MAG: zf-HC2 domain-containing protein [Spirochaetales bacterium]
MCPEKQILSAYFDKELPEPVEKILREHVEGCSACLEQLNTYGKIQSSIRKDSLQVSEHAKTRVYESIVQKMSVGNRLFNRFSLWNRRIGVPVPVLAFTMALVLVLALGITLVSIKQPGSNVMALNRQEAVPLQVTVSDLKELVKLLDSDNFVVEVNMELPVDHNFSILGEPVLTRGQENRAYDLRP